MGDRLPGRAARQHPDLTAEHPDGPAWLSPVVLFVLAVDGVLSALAAAFLLPLRLGAVEAERGPARDRDDEDLADRFRNLWRTRTVRIGESGVLSAVITLFISIS